MKRWCLLIFILGALACLVPFSSQRPDAVQHTLGLPGGVDHALKAMGGILTAAAAIMLLMVGLRKLGRKP
jgi:hypothetical protein